MYKTIVFALLQERPGLYEELRRNRMLRPTLNHYASRLKARHEAWKEYLLQARPRTGGYQIASEALEIAVKEVEDCLTSGAPLSGSECPSLEGLMAFIRGRTPPE